MPSVARRRGLTAAVLALVLLAQISAPSATHGMAGTTVFFVDGWKGITSPAGVGYAAGKEAVAGWMDRPSHLYVEATDADGTFWGLSLVLPDGQVITPGTYATDASVQAGLLTTRGSCYQWPMPASVTIEDLVVDTGIVSSSGSPVTRLAASFTASCERTNPRPRQATHGIVRIDSSAPFDAFGLSPIEAGYGQRHDFGTVPAGSVSDPWTVTVTNHGTSRQSFVASVADDPAFTLDPGGCDGLIDPGSSCSIAVRFKPTSPGSPLATLHLATPGFSIADRTWSLAGTATAPTTMILTVDSTTVNDAYPGAAAFGLTVSPPEARGWYEVTLDCGAGQSGAYLGAGVVWVTTPAGQCSASASFASSHGWLPSSTGPVSFTMPSRSQTAVWFTSEDLFIKGAPITIHARAMAANGVAPSSGWMTLVDHTTGVHLGSGEISEGHAEFAATRSDLSAGTHHVVATYAGGDGVVGSSGAADLRVDADTFVPVGQLGGPSYTADPMVRLQTVASDLPLDIVTTKSLSNDGTHWVQLPYSPTEDWSLADRTTGGTSADGHHTVYAKYRDRAGNWSTVSRTTIVLDTIAPSTGSLRTAPRAGSVLSGTSVPVTLTWSGADTMGGSGIDRYQLERSTDGGAWVSVSTALTTKAASVTAASAGTVRYRVRAVDEAGNVGAWAYSALLAPRLVRETTTGVIYKGTWYSAFSSSYSGGSAKHAEVAGRSVSYTFTGRSIALVTTRAPTRGKVRIYVSGSYVTTVDLYRSSAQYRVLAWQQTWSDSATRTIKLVVAGTSGRPRVDLDAFVVMK